MISFTVMGQPVTQGSMRALISKATGKAILLPSKTLAPWRSTVAWEARKVFQGPLIEGPVVLVADFYVRRPKGLPKRWTHAIKKPDLDKLVRAVGDSLSGVVWRDDSQVISITATKHYGLTPRVEVFITEVMEDQHRAEERQEKTK